MTDVERWRDLYQRADRSADNWRVRAMNAEREVEKLRYENARGATELSAAVKAVERLTQFAEALRNTGDDPTPREIAEDILTLLRVGGDCEDEQPCPQCSGDGDVEVVPASQLARAVLSPEIAAVAATLVDLMKNRLPPHISQEQQVDTYLALRRIAGGGQVSRVAA